MDVTRDTDDLGIGELARLTGVPVRTIRFYCDEGLLPVRRSPGAHRRFDRDSVERLRLVRRLRSLGLGLPAIGRVLAGERTLGEAVAAERAALDVELAALAWRRASLRAVEQTDTAARAVRLALLAGVEHGAAARDALIAFWRRLAVAELPAHLLEAFTDLSVPEPPADPTPGQVVAYAEMVELTRDQELIRRLRARAMVNVELISDEAELMTGLGEATALAAAALAAGEEPGPGPALDRFVEAHAVTRHGGRDTMEFRRSLRTALMLDHDPRLDRYWRLAGEVTGEPVNLGTSHAWLVRALHGDTPP